MENNISNQTFMTKVTAFFKPLKNKWADFWKADKKRDDALIAAQTRLSEDGSPTFSNHLVKHVGKHRLESGLHAKSSKKKSSRTLSHV